MGDTPGNRLSRALNTRKAAAAAKPEEFYDGYPEPGVSEAVERVLGDHDVTSEDVELVLKHGDLVARYAVAAVTSVRLSRNQVLRLLRDPEPDVKVFAYRSLEPRLTQTDVQYALNDGSLDEDTYLIVLRALRRPLPPDEMASLFVAGSKFLRRAIIRIGHPVNDSQARWLVRHGDEQTILTLFTHQKQSLACLAEAANHPAREVRAATAVACWLHPASSPLAAIQRQLLEDADLMVVRAVFRSPQRAPHSPVASSVLFPPKLSSEQEQELLARWDTVTLAMIESGTPLRSSTLDVAVREVTAITQYLADGLFRDQVLTADQVRTFLQVQQRVPRAALPLLLPPQALADDLAALAVEACIRLIEAVPLSQRPSFMVNGTAWPYEMQVAWEAEGSLVHILESGAPLSAPLMLQIVRCVALRSASDNALRLAVRESRLLTEYGSQSGWGDQVDRLPVESVAMMAAMTTLNDLLVELAQHRSAVVRRYAAMNCLASQELLVELRGDLDPLVAETAGGAWVSRFLM